MQRDRPIIVIVHLLEEEFNLLFGNIGMDMFDKLVKLWEAQLLVIFESEIGE